MAGDDRAKVSRAKSVVRNEEKDVRLDVDIAMHYGGRFTTFPGRKYVDGQKVTLKWQDFPTARLIDFKTIIVEYANYDPDIPMFFHYLKPGLNLDVGLFGLSCEKDLENMVMHARRSKRIEVYVEHIKTTLLNHFVATEQGGTSNPTCRRLFSDSDTNEPDQPVQTEHFHEPIHNELHEPDHFEPFHEPIHNELDEPDQYEPFHEPIHNELDEPDQNEPFHEHDEPGQNEPFHENVNMEPSIEDTFPVDQSDMVNDVEVDMNDFNGSFQRDDVNWLGKGVEAGVGEIHVGDETIGIDFDIYDSGDGSDVNEASRKKKLRDLRVQYAGTSVKIIKPPFYLGQTFSDKKKVLALLKDHTVESRRDIRLVKNDATRLRALCHGKIPGYSNRLVGGKMGTSKSKKVGDGSSGSKGKKVMTAKNSCPWTFHVSKVGNDEPWMVKTFIEEHKCLKTRDLRQANSTFLSQHISDLVTSNPDISGEALQDILSKKFEISVTKMAAYRAKDKAVKRLRGDFNAQFGLLQDYILELQNRNPNTTVRLDFLPQPGEQFQSRVFRRIYVCLGSLKQGFKELGREIIGLDGAFMKGPYPGQLLSAVSVDGNNGIYPVAYALAESECRDSWEWFLQCLQDDLDLPSNANFTFISDRQKGILQAVSNIFPSAEHRFCLRHIHENLKTKFRGAGMREHLWFAATRTTVAEFDIAMATIRTEHAQVYEWLRKIPENTWARAHFSGRAKCDILLNNICESFNSKLVKGRDKPIITCLEFIREYLMKRVVVVQKVIDSCEGPLTPTATQILEQAKNEAFKVNVIWNGGDKYQVSGPWTEQCVVDMSERRCSCRKWELTGIPCKHAIASIWNMNDNGFDVGLVEEWVHGAYSLETWKKVYAHKINPIVGTTYWPRCAASMKILPPKHHTQVGRPKKKRKRGQYENESLVIGGKLSKRGKTMTCSKCKEKGHNAKSCKGQSTYGPQKRTTKPKQKKTQPTQPLGQSSQAFSDPSHAETHASQPPPPTQETQETQASQLIRGPRAVQSPKGLRMIARRFSGERMQNT